MIFLLRHAKPIIKEGICYGQLDIPLELRHYLKIRSELSNTIKKLCIKWDVIYSSPLKRCKLLAIYLNKKLSIPVIFEDSLKEFHYGLWEGKSYKDIEQEFTEWSKNYLSQSTPCGESFKEFLKRVESFYYKIIFENINCIIVTHIGVIRCFYLLHQNLPIEKFFDLYLDYGQYIILNSFTKKNNSLF